MTSPPSRELLFSQLCLFSAGHTGLLTVLHPGCHLPLEVLPSHWTAGSPGAGRFASYFSSPHARHLLVLVKAHLIGMNEFIASGPCTQRKFKSFDYIINHALNFSLLPVLPISVNMPSQTPRSHLGVILLLLLIIHSFIHLFTHSVFYSFCNYKRKNVISAYMAVRPCARGWGQKMMN